VKTIVNRLLPTIQTPTRKVALAAAGIAVVGAGIAGPAIAAGSGGQSAAARPVAAAGKVAATGKLDAADGKAGERSDGRPADARKADPATSDAKPADPKQADPKQADPKQAVPAAPAAPDARDLPIDYQVQETFYYCAPASTRIAASAQGRALSQDDIAGKLGTTQEGTPSAEDTTRVLNSIDGNNDYHTTSVPDGDSKRADGVKSDVVRAVSSGRAVIANIKGTATDTDGNRHSFEGGHYLAVVGYSDQGRTVHIADPANVDGFTAYTMETTDLATWMATKGYSS
jgi:hypothetical protein